MCQKLSHHVHQLEDGVASYLCSPSNDSNSSNLTLFDFPPCLPKEDECYVPMDSLEISLFDKTDTCYAYGYDVPMNETCENDYATIIYDNPCYIDKSYDNPLFVPTIDIHNNEECCLEFFYDKAVDDGPMLLDDINCATVENGIGEIGRAHV